MPASSSSAAGVHLEICGQRFGAELARAVVGLPDGFRFYDLRHIGHTLSTRSAATLKDTMVRGGQSSEKVALIYQHSDEERQREVAAGLDDLVRAERAKCHEGDSAHHSPEAAESRWRDWATGLDNKEPPGV